MRCVQHTIARNGYIVGLYGSVPREGAGEDLDMVIFPGLDETQSCVESLISELANESGLKMIWSEQTGCGSIHKAELGRKKLGIRVISTPPAS